jgi:uncharacterized membrane protein YhaH (DUF805 family)
MNWYLAVLKKYATFSGRARRSEYWMFLVFNLIISAVLAFVDGIVGTMGALGILYSLAILLPGIAVSVRRLHDTGRSGWWLLVALVPIVGAIVLIVFAAQAGHAGDNAYGPDPKAQPAAGIQQTIAA